MSDDPNDTHRCTWTIGLNAIDQHGHECGTIRKQCVLPTGHASEQHEIELPNGRPIVLPAS